MNLSFAEWEEALLSEPLCRTEMMLLALIGAAGVYDARHLSDARVNFLWGLQSMGLVTNGTDGWRLTTRQRVQPEGSIV